MELISKMIEDESISEEELKQLRESVRCILDSDYPMQVILKKQYKKLNKTDNLINKIDKEENGRTNNKQQPK